MAENENEDDPFFDWLCTKKIKELSTFLVVVSALQPPEKSSKWRNAYLNGLEDYFMRKEIKKEDFKSTKEYLLNSFDFFNKKEHFEGEDEANRHWAIFVIGWIASNIRAAIEQTKGLPDHSMPPMYG